MTYLAPVTRPDQIAELTRGLDLPLAAIDDIYLNVIADGIANAFQEIRKIAPATIVSGDEAEITALLETRLNAMIDADPMWRQLVASVARGKESLSFDGSHLEKRPDLSIQLTARTRRFPLIAEAKLIDAKKNESLYCSQGVLRFLDGEYGWGGREALMIAYVRDGSTVNSRLAPYLAQTTQITKYSIETSLASLGSTLCDAARSTHGRSFLYAHMSSPKNAPGAIALWDLWMDASGSAKP